MPAKRPPEGGGGGDSPSPARSPALKKRCRSFDLEIRGCRHLEEMVTNCVQRVEAAVESVIESAISRIPEAVTKAITGYLSRAPSLCRTVVDQNQPPRYKLRFLNGLSNEIFTKKGIRAANGDPLKICLEDNNQQENNSHRLLSAKIKIVVLDGDFNIDNEDCWTLENFSRHIVRPRDKIGAVLTGELELSLKNGKADLRDATFIDNSKFTRSGKFRLGVMVVDELGERILEGVTEPFTVKDRRGEGSQKHAIPSLDDDVWRLQKISKDGVFHEALKGSGIFSVKDFLTSYYKDEHTLRKVLKKATKLVWTTIVDHAKKCDPGKELYSFIVEGHDVVLFFNCFYRIVGVTSSDQYTPFKDLNQRMQIVQSEMFMKLMVIKDASFDISVYLGSGSEQYHGSTAANDIPGSVTLHCPAADEFSGSVLLKQASLTMVDEDYDIPFVPSGAFTDEPIYSRHVSFRESDCHEMLALGAEPSV
uniref:Calmodulin-binding protein 60 D n=1 Tax=Aegilops tauschii TaxID=37682 RepID=M8BFA2_AEGTA